jgi:hypothetical protein
MSEPDGEAWIYYCVSLLTEPERSELEQVEDEINKNEETRPDSRSPKWENYWNEYMRLLHRHGELIALGEARAEAGSWDAWTRFEGEYRDAWNQLAKVHMERDRGGESEDAICK